MDNVPLKVKCRNRQLVKDLLLILLPGYGPVIFVNRPVRTRMPGGVGAGGEKPPATRL